MSLSRPLNGRSSSDRPCRSAHPRRRRRAAGATPSAVGRTVAPRRRLSVAPAVPTTYTATFTDTSGSWPPTWSTDRVGSTGTPGSASHASGRFDVQAYGEDVWATSDAFQFTHRSWTGDGEIVARVPAVSLPTGAAFAMAGVMLPRIDSAECAPRCRAPWHEWEAEFR